MKKPASSARSGRRRAAARTKVASASRSGVSLRPIVDAIYGVERAVRLLPSSKAREPQDEALLKFLAGLSEIVQACCFVAEEPFDVMDPYFPPRT